MSKREFDQDPVFLEGDPETDSARRQMERLLKGDAPRRKWPWVVALVAGGGSYALWRMMRRQREEAPDGGR